MMQRFSHAGQNVEYAEFPTKTFGSKINLSVMLEISFIADGVDFR